MLVNLYTFYTTWSESASRLQSPCSREGAILPCSDRQSAFSHKGNTTATLCVPVRQKC